MYARSPAVGFLLVDGGAYDCVTLQLDLKPGTLSRAFRQLTPEHVNLALRMALAHDQNGMVFFDAVDYSFL
jgi:hypothetical protein